MIIILACFAAAGFASGFVLRLPAFACLLAVAGYAVFSDGTAGVLELTYHLVSAGLALQIGYFVAIVFRSLLPGRAK